LPMQPGRLAGSCSMPGCRVGDMTFTQVSKEHSTQAAGRAGHPAHGHAQDGRMHRGRPGALQGVWRAGCHWPHPAHRGRARVLRDWCALSVASALQSWHAKSAVVLASCTTELPVPVLRATLCAQAAVGTRMYWGKFSPPGPHSKGRLDRPCVLPRSARCLRQAAAREHCPGWQPARGAVGAARFLRAVRPLPQSCDRAQRTPACLPGQRCTCATPAGTRDEAVVLRSRCRLRRTSRASDVARAARRTA